MKKRLKAMGRVERSEANVAIIMAIIGATVLVFRETLNLDDLVAGTVAGLIFALIPVVIHIGYDRAKTREEEQKRRQGVFKGIYLEVLESLESMERMLEAFREKNLMVIPPFTRNSWERACSSGYVEPGDKLCQDLVYIYKVMSDVEYIMKEALDEQVKSTLETGEKRRRGLDSIKIMDAKIRVTMPVVKETKEKLEKMLGIPEEEVERLKKELDKRVSSIWRRLCEEGSDKSQ